MPCKARSRPGTSIPFAPRRRARSPAWRFADPVAQSCAAGAVLARSVLILSGARSRRPWFPGDDRGHSAGMEPAGGSDDPHGQGAARQGRSKKAHG